MKPVKITYIADSVERQSEIMTLPQLCDLCRSSDKFEPAIENQLNSVYIGDYEKFAPEDGANSMTISVEDPHTGAMSVGVVKTLNDLIYTVKNVFKSPQKEFYPPLSQQLAENGGWDEDRISEYREFITEIQDALPTDYRLVEVESKVDLFLNFWYNEATEADVNAKTFIDQLIDLKKIVFR